MVTTDDLPLANRSRARWDALSRSSIDLWKEDRKLTRRSQDLDDRFEAVMMYFLGVVAARVVIPCVRAAFSLHRQAELDALTGLRPARHCPCEDGEFLSSVAFPARDLGIPVPDKGRGRVMD